NFVYCNHTSRARRKYRINNETSLANPGDNNRYTLRKRCRERMIMRPYHQDFPILSCKAKYALFDALSSAFFLEVALAFAITLLAMVNFTAKCLMASFPVSS